MYSTRTELEFKDVICYKSILMTLIKCKTEVPKEGALNHKITLEVLTKLNTADLFRLHRSTLQHNFTSQRHIRPSLAPH
jgi:hypothetical protein